MILFGEHVEIPQLASARVKRWAMTLAAYKYKVKYIRSSDNTLADYLSRTPLPSKNAADERNSEETVCWVKRY